MSKLISEGGFGCIYYPGITCDGNKKDKKVVTKVQKDNFTSTNEIKVGDIVKNITGFNLYFLPVLESCLINLREIKENSKEIEKCNIIDDVDNKYLAMNIPYVDQVDFVEIINTRSSKDIILTIIDSYNYLLDALKNLLDIKVIHFDLKLENILFNNETTNPRIIDFGISIALGDLNKENMKEYFYIYAPSYYVWCIDIDIICFLLHNASGPLTEHDADTIATANVASNKGLEIFSEDFKTRYLDKTKEETRKYVGIEKEEAIDMLLKNTDSWDNYSLSIIYLRIIALLFPNNEHKNKLVILLSQLLLLNIHPDPSKRLSIEETRNKFNDIFFIDDNVDSYLNLSKRFNQDKLNTTRRITEDINNLKLPKKTI